MLGGSLRSIIITKNICMKNMDAFRPVSESFLCRLCPPSYLCGSFSRTAPGARDLGGLSLEKSLSFPAFSILIIT